MRSSRFSWERSVALVDPHCRAIAAITDKIFQFLPNKPRQLFVAFESGNKAPLSYVVCDRTDAGESEQQL